MSDHTSTFSHRPPPSFPAITLTTEQLERQHAEIQRARVSADELDRQLFGEDDLKHHLKEVEDHLLEAMESMLVVESILSQTE